MLSSPVSCRLRELRDSTGLSQRALAAQVGVSRQALSAIEAGRQIPSTILALQLAQALNCAVEDMFHLSSPSALGEVRFTRRSAKGQRLHLGCVDGDWVAHPIDNEQHFADAQSLQDTGSNLRGHVDVLNKTENLRDTIFVAGCAPPLALASQALLHNKENRRATWLQTPSDQALKLLEKNLVHIAGLHFEHAHNPDAHQKMATSIWPQQDFVVIRLCNWRQGLAVAPQNPRQIRDDSGLARPELRWVQRQSGSGAQKLLQSVYKSRTGADFISSNPSALLAHSHREIASLIRLGIADVGVTIESAALAQGLDFIPLSEEHFDLLLPAHRLQHPGVRAFIDTLDSPQFRNNVTPIPGYDMRHCGHTRSFSAKPTHKSGNSSQLKA